MDHRISLIRFYALCLAALACAVLWPDVGVGLWPVLFFFPSCLCCGTLCIDCSDGGTTDYQLVIAGLADLNCPWCDDLNATFVVTRGTGCGPVVDAGCRWNYNFNEPSSACTGTVPGSALGETRDYWINLSFYVTNDGFGGNYHSLVDLNICNTSAGNFNCGGLGHRWDRDNGGSAPACNAFSSLSHAFVTTFTGCIIGSFGALSQPCTPTGSTVEATAI
jgi:hypothetical protein